MTHSLRSIGWTRTDPDLWSRLADSGTRGSRAQKYTVKPGRPHRALVGGQERAPRSPCRSGGTCDRAGNRVGIDRIRERRSPGRCSDSRRESAACLPMRISAPKPACEPTRRDGRRIDRSRLPASLLDSCAYTSRPAKHVRARTSTGPAPGAAMPEADSRAPARSASRWSAIRRSSESSNAVRFDSQRAELSAGEALGARRRPARRREPC